MGNKVDDERQATAFQSKHHLSAPGELLPQAGLEGFTFVLYKART